MRLVFLRGIEQHNASAVLFPLDLPRDGRPPDVAQETQNEVVKCGRAIKIADSECNMTKGAKRHNRLRLRPYRGHIIIRLGQRGK